MLKGAAEVCHTFSALSCRQSSLLLVCDWASAEAEIILTGLSLFCVFKRHTLASSSRSNGCLFFCLFDVPSSLRA